MLVHLLSLGPGDILLVKGASSVEVEGGTVSSLAVVLKKGLRVGVRRNKILPFEAGGEGASVKVSLGSGGEYRVASGMVGTGIWSAVLNSLPDFGQKWRAVTVGETDSGKTVFTTFLANTYVQKGTKVGILDVDLGQTDIGPPGCIAGAVAAGCFLDMRSLAPCYLGFVGFTSPVQVWRSVLVEAEKGFRELASRGMEALIANTDGLMTAEGINYKTELIRLLGPDFVVCMKGNTGADVCSLLTGRIGCRVLAAESPVGVWKMRRERAARRLAQYRRFLRNPRQVTLSIGNTVLKFLSKRYGGDVERSQDSIAKTDESGNRLVFMPIPEIIYERRNREGVETVIGTESLPGMFVGLAEGERTRGFGVISRFDFTGRVVLWTPLKENFDTIQLSSIRLSSGLEKEYLVPYLPLPPDGRET